MVRAVFGILLFVLSAATAAAQSAADRGTITISRAWSRAAGPGMSVGAGYMIITNRGNQPDRLLSLRSPAAERVEIHRTTVEDGMARMRQVTDGLAVPANGSVVLAPGGLHLMLVQLKQPLRAGESVPLTLVFEGAGTVITSLTVLPMGASPPKQ